MSGSNPDLTQETSKSLTLGAVITPRVLLPGFDLTIDYFDIKVKNVIAAPSAQQIVNSCYDLPDLNNQFCALFQRNLTGATLATGEVPGQIITQSLQQTPLNFAALKRRGIDVQLNYNHSIGADSRVSVRGYYTHTFQTSDFIDPTRPNLETRNAGQLGDPKNEATLNADLTVSQFTIGYQGHYIGPMLTTAYANLFSINGNPPQNADVIAITEYPSIYYQDLRFSVQIGSTQTNRRGLEWFFGVDNVTDRHPPLGSSATGANSAIYNITGRTYYSGVRATF